MALPTLGNDSVGALWTLHNSPAAASEIASTVLTFSMGKREAEGTH
jgi:hypothetical protein